MTSGKILNYLILSLVAITLIVSAYSTLITAPPTPEINIPEDVLSKNDLSDIATGEDVTGLASKEELADLVKYSDLEKITSGLDTIPDDLNAIKEMLEEIKQTPTPTPTPHPWTMMYKSAHLWENGKSEYIAHQNAPLTNFLYDTLHRLNLQVITYSEEEVEEIKEHIKSVYLMFRFYESVSLLGDVKYAYFILEDNVAEGLEGHVLVYCVTTDVWSCWAIRQEGTDELDISWVEEVKESIEEIIPITPTPPASFSLHVTPERLKGDSIPGQRCIFLVTVEDDGTGKAEGEAVTISAAAPGSTITIEHDTITPGQVAEVTVIPDKGSIGGNITVTVNGEREGVERTGAVTFIVRAPVEPGVEDPLGHYAAEIQDKFTQWLAVEHPELGITSEMKWTGTIVSPRWLVVMHYLFFSEEWEIHVSWHVMIPPHDWARIDLRRRFTESRPSYAFEISSLTAQDEPHAIEPPDTVWR